MALAALKEGIGKMDGRLQKAIDGITANRSVADSIRDGVALVLTNQGAQGAQITELQVQVQGLKDQIASGGAVSAEDLDALGTAADTLAGTNDELGEIAAKLPTAAVANTGSG